MHPAQNRRVQSQLAFSEIAAQLKACYHGLFRGLSFLKPQASQQRRKPGVAPQRICHRVRGQINQEITSLAVGLVEPGERLVLLNETYINQGYIETWDVFAPAHLLQLRNDIARRLCLPGDRVDVPQECEESRVMRCERQN